MAETFKLNKPWTPGDLWPLSAPCVNSHKLHARGKVTGKQPKQGHQLKIVPPFWWWKPIGNFLIEISRQFSLKLGSAKWTFIAILTTPRPHLSIILYDIQYSYSYQHHVEVFVGVTLEIKQSDNSHQRQEAITMTSSNRNLSPIADPLWGEPTGHGWDNNQNAGDLIRHLGYYDVNVMLNCWCPETKCAF